MTYIAASEDDDDIPPNIVSTTLTSVVRGELLAYYCFEPLPFNQTRLTFITNIDLKGSVPKSIANMGMNNVLDTVKRAYAYFERSAEVDEIERLEFIRGMVSERSERALMKTRILAMNPRNGNRHNGYIQKFINPLNSFGTFFARHRQRHHPCPLPKRA